MNVTTNAKQLRASLPSLVERVRRGARFTVFYRSRAAFQIVPMDESAAAAVRRLVPVFEEGAIEHAGDAAALCRGNPGPAGVGIVGENQGIPLAALAGNMVGRPGGRFIAVVGQDKPVAVGKVRNRTHYLRR